MSFGHPVLRAIGGHQFCLSVCQRLQGRMTATMTSLVFAPAPAGSLLAGALGTTLGLRATLWLAGAGVAASALWLVCSPLRGMRWLPEAYEEVGTGSHGP
ncbi:hypothetical protein GCM10027445_60120 [Amycolatopsis endophytica]|uniref:MFS transporter n=1 Tax=Amycolatopsis endophytica TaxID=860233 RepID=A0A853AZX5_9PSEU|nr:hypothetical protein [Amycolatopsis endophytica]NYI88144.1 hypothetical protein [Amycolatopsis endophytica]